MVTIASVVPITKEKISKLRVSQYMLIYMDENKKLKRAIPDFDESFMDYETSLLEEALHSEKLAIFTYVSWHFGSTKHKPVFNLHINDDGEIIKYDNFSNTSSAELEDYLLDSKTRQRMLKRLKKTR